MWLNKEVMLLWIELAAAIKTFPYMNDFPESFG